jgi:hypothetical protein
MTDVIGSIGHALWDAVLPSLATVIAGMVLVLLKQVAKKYGLEITEKQEARLKEIVVDKIHATEEAAHRQEVTTKEGKKAKTVNDALVAAIEDPQIPNPTIEKVSAVVDSELQKIRVGMPDAGLPGMGRR